MLVPLLTTLATASGAICLSVNATEEVVKVAAVVTTVISLFFSLVFAPIVVKLLILLALTLFEKLKIVQFQIK
jgi:hypothetical protein